VPPTGHLASISQGLPSLLKRIPNKFWRFYGVGLFTTVVCWLLYEALYALNISQNFRESASWAISYSLTSVLAHWLHYCFTFDPKRSYWPSLWRALLIYGSSMVLSTVSDHVLAGQMHHRLAWVITMGCFGLLNFFLLRYYAYYEDLPSKKTGPRVAPEA
jgi:putative flippase GtrA